MIETKKSYMKEKISYISIYFTEKIFFKNWVEDTEKDWKHIIKVYLSANS